MSDIPLLISNLSDVGQVREVNEDYLGYFRSGNRHLLVVADGMGGEVGGAVASRAAVEAVQSVFEAGSSASPRSMLHSGVAEANAACRRIKDEKPELAGMGTTLVMALIEEDKVWWANVGDSRLYRISSNQIEQVSNDHTIVKRLMDEGLLSQKDAESHPKRHILERAIGSAKVVEAEVSEAPLELAKGDSLLLCSDGLTDLLDDDEISQVVANLGPDSACRELVDIALSRGGHDNVTVQVAHRGKPKKTWKSPIEGAEGKSKFEIRALIASKALWAAVILLVVIIALAIWAFGGSGSESEVVTDAISADQNASDTESMSGAEEATNKAEGQENEGVSSADHGLQGEAVAMPGVEKNAAEDGSANSIVPADTEGHPDIPLEGGEGSESPPDKTQPD